MNLPRERILSTACFLFHQQGYNNTGINQIIKDANVSKSSFYTHFRSKDDLCIEFLHKRFDYWMLELENFTQTAPSLKEKILKSFDFLIYMNEKENFRGCSFFNLLSDVSEEKTMIITTIRDQKKKLRSFFDYEIKDETMSVYVYLLFESSMITSQLYRSNELIIKSKCILDDIIKNLN